MREESDLRYGSRNSVFHQKSYLVTFGSRSGSQIGIGNSLSLIMSKMDGYMNPSLIDYDSNNMKAKPQPQPRKHNAPNNANTSAYMDMQNNPQNNRSQGNVSMTTNPHDGFQDSCPSQKSRKRENPDANIFDSRISHPDGYLNPRNSDYNRNHNPPSSNGSNKNANPHPQSPNSYMNDHQPSAEITSYLNVHPTQYDLERQQSSGKTRFDSGVGDLEMHGVSPLPRNSMAYDYADTANHYEEVPTLQREPPYISEDNGRPVGDLNTSKSSEITSDTDDNTTVFRSTVKRKYTNPLYSRMVSAASSFFSDDPNTDPMKKMETLEHQIFCQCMVIVILFIVTLGATALSIYLMIGQSESSISNNELLLRIQKLEETYHKSSPVKINTSKGIEYDLKQISVNQEQIQFTYNNLSEQLNSLADTLQQQIYNVSKMEGPAGVAGPPGVGNLTACYYSNFTSNTIADSTSSTTKFAPGIEVLQDNIIMSASCLFDGARFANLEVIEIGPNKLQYRCRCWEKIDNKAVRKCVLHLFLCPQLS